MKKLAKIVLSILLVLVVASPMFSQTILKDKKIPKDLIITLRLGGTIQFANYYAYKINSEGNVFYKEIVNLPPQTSFLELLGIKAKSVKSKKPKLKNKLSKEQIKRIIFEFENSGFFLMNESYYGDLTLKEAVCGNHALEKSLSISANGKVKNVSFFLGCSYSENSPLKSFLSLYDKIEKELSGVKKTRLIE